MTTTFILDEALRNQTLAALDERAAKLAREIQRTETFIAGVAAIDRTFGSGLHLGEDLQRALVWSIAALHETKLARLTIGEAPPTPWTEAELRLAAGDR